MHFEEEPQSPLGSRGSRRFSEVALASSFEGLLPPEFWASSRPVSAFPFAATFSCRQGCFFFLAADLCQSLVVAPLGRGESSFQPSRCISYLSSQSASSLQRPAIRLLYRELPSLCRSFRDRCARPPKRPLATGVLCVQHNTTLGGVELPLAPTAEGAGTQLFADGRFNSIQEQTLGFYSFRAGQMSSLVLPLCGAVEIELLTDQGHPRPLYWQ